MATLPAQLHDEQLLTTEQVATLTGISRQTFEGWRCRKDGGPKFTKLGPQIIRYRWLDIRQWCDAGTIVPTA
ncbi:MAG: helix-turn-helix transcriptional regulator [Steroidobacteraceae bacterium]